MDGNRINMDWYVFHVDPNRSGALSAGWAPHRDRMSNADAMNGFRENGVPKYNTCWVPLSDATVDNSCLMILPKGSDSGYHGDQNPDDVFRSVFGDGAALQSVRALPCPQGSLVSFSHRTLHWGSHPTSLGHPARIALSFACSEDAFEAPYFDRSMLPLPPFDVRLGLVCGQLLLYAPNNENPLDPAAAALYFSGFRSAMGQLSQSLSLIHI
eukprot:TRINITY_DN22117_c0_g1_i1.p1 TRINITY_DN22117_c0_g1~~TRINITY_DN22117_c0_g1_i1.p1  ORF type:complete len:212 (+),score=27.63 TRINITY_DN22117_c0_g1_i1:168-803(+)